MYNTVLSMLFLFLCSFNIFGQTEYQKGWESLNNAKLEEAIQHFELAKEDASTKQSALLTLMLLYSQRNKEPLASKYFKEFVENVENPYPEIYALWFEAGVVGYDGKKRPYQFELLKNLEKRKDNKGKLDAATIYRMLSHYEMSFDRKTAFKYGKKIKNVNDWQLLGPFDNVMNSGFDKDLGVLDHPESTAQFDSRYGAKVTWFDPPENSLDGYLFKDNYFRSSYSIVYAQTFIEAPTDQEVILKFGYSGSLKLWINDELIYQDPEHRRTEMDYYRFKLSLHKGYNRILVQLGEYEEAHPSFTVRFTDLEDNALLFPTKTTAQSYKKGAGEVEQIPYFAIEALKKKAESDDPLYQIILAKAYMRSLELDKAEKVLKDFVTLHPRNYFVLRSLINMYSKSNNTTNQNKYYATFEENYEYDKDILDNNIQEAKKKKENEKAKELIKIYLSKYSNNYQELRYGLVLASMDNNNEKVLKIIDKMYKKYPEQQEVLLAKYKIEKSYHSSPKKAEKILENYLKNNYNYGAVTTLVASYFEKGNVDKALKLLKKSNSLGAYIDIQRTIVDILSRQSKYDEAIKECKKILKNRPSDYLVLQDLAILNTYNDDKEKAIHYYEQALEYFPFSFETNEKIRELKGVSRSLKLIPEIDPIELIKDYEKNYTPPIKKPLDIVYESMSTIIYKADAKATVHRYILKLNDDTAIEDWQHATFGADRFMTLYFDELQTIKKNGQKIDAERNGGEAVFTNLEVGDYIYVAYTEKQTGGGKSAFFINDRFKLNAYSPTYYVEYNVLTEGDIPIKYNVLNGDLKPKITEVEDFKKYTWMNTSAPVIKEESYSPPYYDVATTLHFSLDYTWKDIVQWYGDLSTHQAAADFTVNNLVKELFDGKNMKEEEKAKTLYNFVCENIKYSSVDFRQSGYIPQKASKIYHARLGDCKDVSTLYVALARAAGLQANLVLINTRDQGQKMTYLPSLNFNHCIVKVYLPDGPKYLELTDQDLPYGQLYYYHDGATILEIPTQNVNDNTKLEYLKLNNISKTHVYRNGQLDITSDLKMAIKKETIKTGTRAAKMVRDYYYSDDKLRKDDLKKALSSSFKSTLSIKTTDYELLLPRRDTAKYEYSYVVDKDVLKLGSLRTFKIPFSDVLITMNIFEDTNREHEFNFKYYEDTDKYEEKLIIKLPNGSSFKEVPANVHATFNGSVYDLKFRKINANELEVHRVYTVNRENIEPKDFTAFKEFMIIVNESENTHLLFQ